MEDRAMSFLARVLTLTAVLACSAPTGAAAAAFGPGPAAALPALNVPAASSGRGNYRCTRAYHHCRFNTDDKQRCEAVRKLCTEGGRKKN
jgi:hypothetical protein